MPDGCVAVLSATFCVEAIRLSDAAGLVVSSDEMDAIRVAKLQADQEGNRLD